jgi:uncharacterized surface protein with fasciclin (FAS1) repeats
MKLKTFVLSLAVVGILFVSCDDTKKKQAEADAAKVEQMKLDEAAKLKAEEEAAVAKMEIEKNSIASIAMGNENFSTLVAALQAADLVETFKGEGEFTVFAPTNDAFAKVPKATLDNLLKPENKTALQNLLKYHVVSGEWKAADLAKAIADNNNKYNVTTLQGENLVLSVTNGKVMIKDAKGGTSTVTMADVDASNGVIHAIDKVLMHKN